MAGLGNWAFRGFRFMKNNIEEFTRAWTEAQPFVRGFLAFSVPDFHAAEDILQDVGMALLRQFQEGAVPEPSQVWAVGIARKKVLMYLRSRSRSQLVFDEDVINLAAAAYEDMLPELQLRSTALHECVTHLAGRSGELVRLRYIENLSYDEIAKRLGMTAVAARVGLCRVRDALKNCIERRMAVEARS
jgi:RNA polymerase sigma-70 factor, ECF subfamily